MVPDLARGVLFGVVVVTPLWLVIFVLMGSTFQH